MTLSDDRVLGDIFNDTYTSASFNDKNVGNSKPVSVLGIAISGADAGNYTFNTTASATANIISATLTITANNTSKTYGETHTFAGTEFTTSGLVNGDTVTSVTLSSAGAATSAVKGSYAITPSAATGTGLGNYTITYADGSLTVDAKPLTITAANRTIPYGDAVTFAGSEFHHQRAGQRRYGYQRNPR